MRTAKDLPEEELSRLLSDSCKKTDPKMTAIKCPLESSGLKKCADGCHKEAVAGKTE